MTTVLRCLYVVLICFVLGPAKANGQKQMVLSIVNEGHIIQWYKRYMIKTYSDLGYRVIFKQFPPGRGALEANKGEIDGLTIRVSAIEDQFPDFIRVPVLLTQGDLVLYCQLDIPCDVSVLDEKSNIVGIVSGTNITNQYMRKRQASLYEVKDGITVADMFNKKRLNYILTIDTPEFGNYASIPIQHRNAVPLITVKAYHYINIRHKKLLPEILAALENAKRQIGPMPLSYIQQAR